ncbi:MAG: hypothetical protein ISR58_18210 [Anaerolineales bacterium]|nr:hypothetical protein [Chloroflexota bacterium]MBL6983113.1 hypothetical protein [Anaerolineales bacterium]
MYTLLLGMGRFFLRMPRPIWQKELVRGARSAEKSLTFMIENHHEVRDFVYLHYVR